MKLHFNITLVIFISLLFVTCDSIEHEKKSTNRLKDSTLLTSVDPVIARPATIKKAIDYDSALWSDISFINSNIIVDMKYATRDNFVKEKMYECSRCFLRPEVAIAITKIQATLELQGLGLKMLDCFRPRPIQWKLWNKVPDPRFVADPRKGSMHNRGVAVDLTLVDYNGKELNMGTPYDFFGPEAYSGYQHLPDSILERRKLLRNIMTAHGFKSITTEWWHFSWTGKVHPLSDMLWRCE